VCGRKTQGTGPQGRALPYCLPGAKGLTNGCCCCCCCCCWAQAVKVNSFGKWKTALQMSSMSLLLFCRDEHYMPRAWKGAWLALQAPGATCPFSIMVG
jgi:hypothetical protein